MRPASRFRLTGCIVSAWRRTHALSAAGISLLCVCSALADSSAEHWSALCKTWTARVGAAKCATTVAVQDGDLASDQNATACVIAWDAADRKFALLQSNVQVLVRSNRMVATRIGADVAVDRAITIDSALALRQEIPESPWPQLGMALRNQSDDWWKDIDPELGVVALKSCVKKDDGTAIAMLVGKYGWLELMFDGQTGNLVAATRRIESGPRVPMNAAIEWRMTFDSIDIPPEILTLDVQGRRRVERLDDLQSPGAKKESTKSSQPLMPNMQEMKPEPKPEATPNGNP